METNILNVSNTPNTTANEKSRTQKSSTFESFEYLRWTALEEMRQMISSYVLFSSIRSIHTPIRNNGNNHGSIFWKGCLIGQDDIFIGFIVLE